jgi:hypothetical protein
MQGDALWFRHCLRRAAARFTAAGSLVASCRVVLWAGLELRLGCDVISGDVAARTID